MGQWWGERTFLVRNKRMLIFLSIYSIFRNQCTNTISKGKLPFIPLLSFRCVSSNGKKEQEM